MVSILGLLRHADNDTSHGTKYNGGAVPHGIKMLQTTSQSSLQRCYNGTKNHYLKNHRNMIHSRNTVAQGDGRAILSGRSRCFVEEDLVRLGSARWLRAAKLGWGIGWVWRVPRQNL